MLEKEGYSVLNKEERSGGTVDFVVPWPYTPQL